MPKTKKKRSALKDRIYEGYIFHFDKAKKGVTYMNCAKRDSGCSTRAYIKKGIFSITEKSQPHNHGPSSLSERSELFIKHLKNAVCHQLRCLELIYNDVKKQFEADVPKAMTFFSLKSRMISWRKNAVLPEVNTFNEVEATVTSPEWQPLLLHDHGELVINCITVEDRPDSLMFGCPLFTRKLDEIEILDISIHHAVLPKVGSTSTQGVLVITAVKKRLAILCRAHNDGNINFKNVDHLKILKKIPLILTLPPEDIPKGLLYIEYCLNEKGGALKTVFKPFLDWFSRVFLHNFDANKLSLHQGMDLLLNISMSVQMHLQYKHTKSDVDFWPFYKNSMGIVHSSWCDAVTVNSKEKKKINNISMTPKIEYCVRKPTIARLWDLRRQTILSIPRYFSLAAFSISEYFDRVIFQEIYKQGAYLQVPICNEPAKKNDLNVNIGGHRWENELLLEMNFDDPTPDTSADHVPQENIGDPPGQEQQDL